ncbi:chorismate mutase family protein [Nocardia terpenica]|uniref:Chorismate mutase family protein n=1 Tax=Nocardia terpenica TaxID=455432 RepID=A0A6G9Z975_9NOCA|nr:chorismate mutase family protein [Nocardia terpenica]QIS22159.1 chorismate mutase family protein [Nocardia terpenica]
MVDPSPSQCLEKLREELDAIDLMLLKNLNDRIQCCVQIAQYKREHSVPMMQPHRISFVKERAFKFGAEHGIDTEFLSRLYDLIIGETCRVESLVIEGKNSGSL